MLGFARVTERDFRGNVGASVSLGGDVFSLIDRRTASARLVSRKSMGSFIFCVRPYRLHRNVDDGGLGEMNFGLRSVWSCRNIARIGDLRGDEDCELFSLGAKFSLFSSAVVGDSGLGELGKLAELSIGGVIFVDCNVVLTVPGFKERKFISYLYEMIRKIAIYLLMYQQGFEVSFVKP